MSDVIRDLLDPIKERLDAYVAERAISDPWRREAAATLHDHAPADLTRLCAALNAVDTALDQLDRDRHAGDYGDGIAAAVAAVRYEIGRAVRG